MKKKNRTLKLPSCNTQKLAIVLVVVLLGVCASSTVLAQAPAFTIDNYSIENGLPNNLVEDLEWDENNILWISTFRGIGRFDGRWIYPFTMHNGSLRGDHDGPLVKNGKGNLFFGDIQGDIYTIKNNRPVLTDSQYRKLNIIASPRVLQLPPAFWPSLFTSKNRLFQNQNSNSPVLLNNESFLFVQDKFLLIYDRIKDQYDTLQHFENDISLFKINQDIMLHNKGTGIFRVSVAPSKKLSLTPVKMEGYSDDTEVLWLSAMEDPIAVQGTNCYLLTWANGMIGRKLLCDILPAQLPVTSIRYNKVLDVLAVATAGKGIYIVRKKYLRTHFININSIISSPQFFYSLIETKDQQLMLPFSHQLNLSTGVVSKQTVMPDFWTANQTADSSIYYSDKDNNVFSLSAGEKLPRKRLSFAPLPGYSTFARSGGRIFYSVKNMLVELGAEKDSLYFKADFETSQLARAMLETRPGYLVLAGAKGIFGFDVQSKKLELLYKDDRNIFESVIQYQDYIFTTNYTTGLVIYRNGKAVKAPHDKLRSMINVHTVFVDKNGYAWFSTDNGVLRTQVQALINYYNDTTSYVGYQFFGKKEGMEISEINGGVQGSIAVLRNGNLAYPGINGVVSVDRNAASTETMNNRIFIDEISTEDSLVIKDPGKEVTLPDYSRNIKISLVNADWNISDKIIEYRLEGHSDNWKLLDFSKQNFIEFQNIHSGRYLLEIRELSVFDRTLTEMHTLMLHIEHPWYKTTWFKLLLALIIILLIWGISAWRNHYLRIRNRILQKTVDIQVQEINYQKEELETQLEKLEKDYAMKNRLISMIGHDIITPLRFMSSAGNKLLHHKETISQETYDDVVKTMVETGNNLKDMSTNMLNWIKHHSQHVNFEPETFDLHEMVQQVLTNVAPMAKFKNLTLNNRSMEDVQMTQFAEPLKNIIFQLVSNSIKYCNDGSIDISNKIYNENLQLVIKDEGLGMTAPQIEHLTGNGKSGTFTSTHENKGHGFGYLIIKDMLNIIKGTMSITSERNKGTEVTITLPIHAITQ